MQEYLNINLDSLKAIPIKVKRGIYFLYSGEELVYIGQSKRIQQRIYTEHLASEKVFDSYRYIEIPEDVDLDQIEMFYILEHTPKYNKNSLGNGAYSKDLRKPIKKRKEEIIEWIIQ